MLRPLHDNVVLEVEPTEEKVGGLIIPNLVASINDILAIVE